MIDLYNAPSPEVLEWLRGEVRSNLSAISAYRIKKGNPPIHWDDEDIECLVQNFLTGVNEQITIDIASRFEIEEDLL